MLGWSIHIKRNDETVLYAESTDLGLDSKIRDRAEEILDSAYYRAWGYGYPNRYHIRNAQLPHAQLYRYISVPGAERPRIERETLELGVLPDIPGDELLWVELWDQS